MIFILCPDDNTPWGGIRKLYRHADVLNQLGLAAAILHQQPGFRCTWFPHQTRIAYSNQTTFAPTDVLVLPEIYSASLARIAPGIRKVIFNQNCYNTFRGYGLQMDNHLCPYIHPQVIAALTVSHDSFEYLRYAFPTLRIYRLRYGIDRKLFAYHAQKKPLICFMPRKQHSDAEQVLNILRFRNALNGFQVLPLANRAEGEVAAALRDSRLFLSFGYPEGFGLPPAEAMACGCLTIGYHGNGGREYFRPELAFPIEVGDILGFARTVEEVLCCLRQSPETFESRTRRASEFIHEEYSLKHEAEDIQRTWRAILAEPLTVSAFQTGPSPSVFANA
jgi:Glycosyl transferases group 1